MAERPDVIERFVRYRRTGDRRLRNELIEEHRWVAVHCARRFDNRGEPLDDLIQVGMLGVLKAAERFDPEVGVSFTTFAIPTALGELRRHFRDTTWAVRVPRRMKDLHVELGAAVEFLTGELGRVPRIPELARHLGVSHDVVLETMEASGAYRAAPLASGSDDDRDGGSESEAVGALDADLALADDRLTVRALLRGLAPRERRIVYLRYFDGLSQSEIAEIVGVSQVHVSRLLRASIDRLHDVVGATRPSASPARPSATD
ncbi:MAG: SigB/SigF/SigG family RNA polymerase sigma factor [Acidimicrobiales bacterium]